MSNFQNHLVLTWAYDFPHVKFCKFWKWNPLAPKVPRQGAALRVHRRADGSAGAQLPGAGRAFLGRGRGGRGQWVPRAAWQMPFLRCHTAEKWQINTDYSKHEKQWEKHMKNDPVYL